MKYLKKNTVIFEILHFKYFSATSLNVARLENNIYSSIPIVYKLSWRVLTSCKKFFFSVIPRSRAVNCKSDLKEGKRVHWAAVCDCQAR